jgi:Domain of unknown function (DUF4384)/Putative peptidoglycan binding domain
MNSKRAVLRNLLIGMLGASLIGCVEVKQDVKEELPALMKGPQEAPTRNITNFASALRCMDRMMIDYGIYDVSMLVEDFKDNTGNVKAGARDMLISAISDMTRRSHAIRLIAFGADSGNLVSFLASAQDQRAYQVVPQYDIRGSISQLDKDVAAKDVTAGVEIGAPTVSLGIGGSKTAHANVMAIDMAVMQTKDMSVLAGVTSRNQIVIFKEGSGTDVDASVGNIPKLGVNFSMNLVRAEGDAQALRNLIELAAIELVGKLTKTPYWKCLGIDPKREEIQNEVYDWYYNLVADQLIVTYFQQQLRNRNYYAGPIDGKYNAQLTEAVKRYQQGLGMTPNGNIDQPLFTALLNEPAPPLISAAPVASPQSASQTASLDIHFADRSQSVLRRGEQFQIVVEPSQDAHVACYFQSEDGSIQRFFPNRFVQDSLVKTRAPLMLPGSMPFKLFANRQGKQEELACFSSPTPVMNSLPATVKGTDFENLPVRSLREVETAFQRVVGKDMGGDYFEIKVQ